MRFGLPCKPSNPNWVESYNQNAGKLIREKDKWVAFHSRYKTKLRISLLGGVMGKKAGSQSEGIWGSARAQCGWPPGEHHGVQAGLQVSSVDGSIISAKGKGSAGEAFQDAGGCQTAIAERSILAASIAIADFT